MINRTLHLWLLILKIFSLLYKTIQFSAEPPIVSFYAIHLICSISNKHACNTLYKALPLLVHQLQFSAGVHAKSCVSIFFAIMRWIFFKLLKMASLYIKKELLKELFCSLKETYTFVQCYMWAVVGVLA